MDANESIKHISVLESLKLKSHIDDKKKCNTPKPSEEWDEKACLEHNVNIIQSFLKLGNLQMIVEETIRDLHLQPTWQKKCQQDKEICKSCRCFGTDLSQFQKSCLHFESISNQQNELDIREYTYVIHLQCLLMKIINEINALSRVGKDDSISLRQRNNCVHSVQDLTIYALRRQLFGPFYETSLFMGQHRNQNKSSNYALLFLSLQIFESVLAIPFFHGSNAMESVIRDYIAAVFTLHAAHINNEYFMDRFMCNRLTENLTALWKSRTKIQYFRNIMLLKSISRLPTQLQRLLHLELIGKLHAGGGFKALVVTLASTRTEQQESAKGIEPINDKQVFQLIANIATLPGYSKDLHNTLVTQVFSFLEECLLHESMMECMGAGLLTLRRLYEKNDHNKTQIVQNIRDMLTVFVQPTDLLTGLIVKNHQEFSTVVALLYQIFCTSTVECLPSGLLVPYLPLLLQMYYHLPENFLQKRQLAALVIRCLHNRSSDELHNIIQKLYLQQLDESWCELHPRVVIFPNSEETQLTVKITSADSKHDNSISLSLPELLMNSDHHLLTYRVFMILLNLMTTVIAVESCHQYEKQILLLQTEEELLTFLNAKYPVQVDILLSLNTLISHQPLKTQIAENSMEFLKFLRTFLEKRLNKKTEKNTETMDQILLILLTVIQEMVEQTQIPETYRDFLPTLHKLQAQTPNELVKKRISYLSTLLSGDFKANAAQQSTAFNTARAFVEAKEAHLQVYGIHMLIDLLRRKDSVTLSNGHLLIALALSTLKNKESYIFLNCVRLFVSLVHVMEAEVLETLSDEYLSETADIDYRLVVGEAILKVGQEIGPLSYKYKDVLLNCYLAGARSIIDEFRMSSLVNLAQMARVLCYQVYSYFQELLLLIDKELTTGKYLPAKRAAVLVLSELLEGMDNLVDSEEMLLPIYRLLKTLEADERVDPKIRQHAANGLKALAEKCKKFMFPEERIEKEIRILGIKDKKSTRSNILELN